MHAMVSASPPVPTVCAPAALSFQSAVLLLRCLSICCSLCQEHSLLPFSPSSPRNNLDSVVVLYLSGNLPWPLWGGKNPPVVIFVIAFFAKEQGNGEGSWHSSGTSAAIVLRGPSASPRDINNSCNLTFICVTISLVYLSYDRISEDRGLVFDLPLCSQQFSGAWNIVGTKQTFGQRMNEWVPRNYASWRNHFIAEEIILYAWWIARERSQNQGFIFNVGSDSF